MWVVLESTTKMTLSFNTIGRGGLEKIKVVRLTKKGTSYAFFSPHSLQVR